MAYEAVYRRERPAQYLSAGHVVPHEGWYWAGRERRYTAEYGIRGWLCIYYTFQAFKSIYLRYLPYLSCYGTRHVDISPTEKRIWL